MTTAQFNSVLAQLQKKAAMALTLLQAAQHGTLHWKFMLRTKTLNAKMPSTLFTTLTVNTAATTTKKKAA